MAVVRETRDAVTGSALVVADAARLLVRHLPALLTVFLLGLAVRNGAMWGAVLLGRDHAILASLLVPLAPLAMVVTLVLMLRIAGASLAPAGAGPGLAGQLALVTSALIPFLTVYALTGELTEDRNQFVNESYADDFQNFGTAYTSAGLADRTIATVGHWQIALVAVFLVIRLAIDVLDLEERHPAWAVTQVLVEVTWLTWLATFITGRWGDVKGWVRDRVLVTWVADAWRSATDQLGPLRAPLRAVSDLATDAFHRVGDVVVTPVAWLAVGAVVIVGALPAGGRARPELPVVARRWRDLVGPRWERLRSRRASAKVLELLGRRFEDLGDGLRVLVHAGILPVLAFCLVLPLARAAEWGTALVLHAVVGPRDPDAMLSFSTYLDIVTRAAYTLVVVVLVVAAVDRLLLRREEKPVDQVPSTSIST